MDRFNLQLKNDGGVQAEARLTMSAKAVTYNCLNRGEFERQTKNVSVPPHKGWSFKNMQVRGHCRVSNIVKMCRHFNVCVQFTRRCCACGMPTMPSVSLSTMWLMWWRSWRPRERMNRIWPWPKSHSACLSCLSRCVKVNSMHVGQVWLSLSYNWWIPLDQYWSAHGWLWTAGLETRINVSIKASHDFVQLSLCRFLVRQLYVKRWQAPSPLPTLYRCHWSGEFSPSKGQAWCPRLRSRWSE